MFLSIVIPHYNLPQTLLKRCIDSISATELPPDCYEIIIIDDGSATPPRWVNETYPTLDIKLIENKHNCQGAARNTGIDTAKGEYIQFVDADDTLQNNNAMQQCMEILEQERPDILRFNYRTCPKYKAEKRRVLKNTKFGNTISGAVYMAENNLPASVCCYFTKKELLTKKEIRFTHGLYHEDEEFSTIVHFHAKTLIESNAPIYNYCIRRNSTTTATTNDMVEKRLKDRMTVLKKLSAFRETANSNSIQKKALRRKLTTLTVDFIINHLFAGNSATKIYNLCTEHLAPFMLYPIEKGDFGYKFKIFRKLANSKTGLRILRLIVPSYNKPSKA